ncbi:MAG TPA: NAD(P)/FAD-dependent oxidoreductase [Bryobacteraceae bacterium]|nr:NAD(P)/FAD-dependent oxidoreductase [Bryobacteraceae bacterium]
MSTSYRQQPPEGAWDAIAIGSGMGALAAAAWLARRAGKRVLVLERHYTAGGFTHVFRRPGYEWDVGVHYVGQMRAGEPMRALCDEIAEGRLQWKAMPEVYDRIRIADRSYDFVSGAERFTKRMREYFPREGAAIGRYVTQVRDAARASRLFFAEKAIPAVLARLAGPTMRHRFLSYARRTTAETLARLTSDRELAAVLTGQWGDYGLPPGQSSFGMHAIIAEHYLEGAFYPVGGAARIAASIAPAIERAGGRIVVGAEVERILLDARKRAAGVCMADGRELRAPLILSDAGAWNTYAKLLPPDAPGRAQAIEEIERIPNSMSHVCLYVGLRRDAGEPEFGDTNLWIYPSADHDANMARYAADAEQPFPGLFISFPSAKDPEFTQRYPGRATIEVVALAPYGWFERWAETRWKRRGADYDALKQRLAERLRAELERNVPAVRGKIEYCELSTPLSTRHFANYHQGQIYGPAGTPERFRAHALSPRTPIRNLYLTGADAAVLGVAGALAGGALAASAVLHRNVMAGP